MKPSWRFESQDAREDRLRAERVQRRITVVLLVLLAVLVVLLFREVHNAGGWVEAWRR
jgi:hypothetical protein